MFFRFSLSTIMSPLPMLAIKPSLTRRAPNRGFFVDSHLSDTHFLPGANECWEERGVADPYGSR